MEKYLKHKFYEENLLPYYDGIFYYALRILKNRESAEDTVQSTFEKAWRNLHRLRDTEKARSWLFAIARNEIFTKLKKQKIVSQCEFSDDLIPIFDENVIETNVLSIVMNRESHQTLRTAMSRLTDKYQEILELRFFWECSEKEIAGITGMKYSTVRVYIHRALRELTNIYKQIEEGGTVDEKECV